MKVLPTTIEHKKVLHPYSYSRLTAVNMCPMWGAIHGQKQYESHSRPMALEAGALLHQVYAGVRLWQLQYVQKLKKHADFHGQRVFGKERYAEILTRCDSHTDERTHLMEMAFAILHTAKWEDNPDDKVRTMSNMELSAVCYIDERMMYFENWPIWVEDAKKPQARVGIEQVFDVTLWYEDNYVIRYIGTVDGLVLKDAVGKLFIDENKTASRVDEAWRSSFEMSHQVTGYCASSTAVYGLPVFNVRVTGAKVKPTGRGEDCVPIEVSRTPESIVTWGAWVRHTVDTYEMYKDNWEAAPRYTHSCNRYFRPCALIPFCADTAEGRQEQWEQMVAVDLSPSELALREL